MEKYKKLKDTRPSHLAKRTTNVRFYSKEFKDQVLKTIASLIHIGLQRKDIDSELKAMYGLDKTDTFWRDYRAIQANGLILAELDTIKSIDLLAKAKNRIIVDRKLNAKQRNVLNYETSVISYREAIKEILESFKGKTYLRYSKPIKVSQNQNKPLKKAIYIIADEHFKGKCDILHLNRLYDKIENDIKVNNINYVELGYLGDGIDGLIHTGQLASNDGTIKPAIDYINILVERVNRIKQVKSIKYVAQSNHTQTRPLNTSRNELAREDINYMLIEIMKRGLRSDISLLAEDILQFKYDNLAVAMLHGHQPYAKNKNKIIEYGSAKYHLVPDIILMGHYHQFKVSEYGINKGLVVAPTAKQFNGDYEKANGFISYSQITKMTIKNKTPSFEIINIKGE